MSKVVTANQLTTGIVVFLGKNGSWTHDVAAAKIYATAEEAETGLLEAKDDEARALIVEPFVTDVGAEVEGRPKMTLRDTIRAFGPTISYLPTVKPVARG